MLDCGLAFFSQSPTMQHVRVTQKDAGLTLVLFTVLFAGLGASRAAKPCVRRPVTLQFL
jgi:hypothetical protein